MNKGKIKSLALFFLLLWFGVAMGKTPRILMQEVEGTVKEIQVEKASPKAKFGFVTAVLATDKEEMKVRLYPEWWKLKPPFTVGSRIKVKGWVPPRTAFTGQPVLVAAEIKNLDTGEVLVLREGPGKPRWRFGMKAQIFSGKIVSRKIRPGIGRPQIKWLVIEVRDKEGRVGHFRISPLWLNDYPELKTGEKVKIWAYRPPFWAARGIKEYMACRIMLMERDQTIDLRKCPQKS